MKISQRTITVLIGLLMSVPVASTTSIPAEAHDDPSHIYAIVQTQEGTTLIVRGGEPNRSSLLPVAFKLPDEQGWVAISYGAKLQHKDAAFGWTKPRDNAFLVDSQANQVRVTRDGRQEVVHLEK